jgi:hypothetical protein
MRLISLVGAVVSLTLLAGCGAQPGKTVVKWDGTASRMTEASENATYALYSSTATNPDISYPLRKGDAIGFVTENGKTYAVAGQHKDEIKPSKVYYWKRQAE